MKIVINRCYGGFNLSPAAVKRLAQLRGKKCYFFTRDFKTDKYVPATEEQVSDQISWSAFSVPNPNEYLATSDWHSLSPKAKEAHNKKYARVALDRPDEKRDDPLLLQVVEELGKKASGIFAELKVVEIPDGVQWEIEEYDGLETVRETHRSWR